MQQLPPVPEATGQTLSVPAVLPLAVPTIETIRREAAPLTRRHLANVIRQSERLGPPAPLARGWRGQSSTALCPEILHEMETEWENALKETVRGRLGRCDYDFVSSNFLTASHMLNHVRGKWGVRAALTQGIITQQFGQTYEDDVTVDMPGYTVHLTALVGMREVAKRDRRFLEEPILRGRILSPFGR